jgi:uncharacterized membrane protein
MDRLSGLKWVLLASLLVNAAFFGFVVAQMTGRGFGPHPPSMVQMVRQQRQDIRPETRAALNEAFRDERPAMERALREWADARRKAVGILRADPLDPKELDAAMEQMRVKTLAAQEVYHRVVSKAAGKLNADDRIALARILDPTPGRFGPNGVFGGLIGPRRGPGPGQPGRDGGMGPGGPPPK